MRGTPEERAHLFSLQTIYYQNLIMEQIRVHVFPLPDPPVLIDVGGRLLLDDGLTPRTLLRV